MAEAGPQWSSWRQVTVWSQKEHMNIKSSAYGAKRPAGLLVMSSQTLRKSLQQSGGDNEEGEEQEERAQILWGRKRTEHRRVSAKHSRQLHCETEAKWQNDMNTVFLCDL